MLFKLLLGANSAQIDRVSEQHPPYSARARTTGGVE